MQSGSISPTPRPPTGRARPVIPRHVDDLPEMVGPPTSPPAYADPRRSRPAYPGPSESRSQVYAATRQTDAPKAEDGVETTPYGPPWPVLAVPIALLTGLLTYIRAGRQMWIDEYATVYVTTLSWGDFTRLLGNQDLVHALYYLAIRQWTGAFGTSLLALRLPSMIGMAVAAGAVVLLGRRMHSTAVGVAAGLVFAVLPAVSRYGQEARSYAWVVALAVLSTLALTSALDRPTKPRWLIYLVLTIALTYLHFAAAMVLLPQGLMALHAWRRRTAGQLGWWTAMAALVTVTAAPLLYLASGQSGLVSWIRSDWAAVQRYPVELFGSDIVFWAVVLLGAIGAARLMGAAPGVALPLLAWALVPPLLSYVTVDFAHLFLAKYSLFTLPAWALLAGAGLAVASADRRRAFSMAQLAGVLAGVLVLAVAGLAGQREMRRSPLDGEPDFRAAARIVDAQFQPGDGIAYVGTYRWARLPFAYELHSAKPADVFAANTPSENGLFYPRECKEPARCLGTTPRVWLVVSNYSGDDYLGMPANQAEQLRHDYHVTSTEKLEHIRVLLLVRNAG